MTKHLVTFVEKREIVVREDDPVLCHEDCLGFFDNYGVRCMYFNTPLVARDVNTEYCAVNRCAECILATGAGAWDCANNKKEG